MYDSNIKYIVSLLNNIIHTTQTILERENSSNKVLIKIDYNMLPTASKEIFYFNKLKNKSHSYILFGGSVMFHRLFYYFLIVLFNHVQLANKLSNFQSSYSPNCTLAAIEKLLYLDDGTIGGDPETLLDNYETLIND